MKKRFLFPALLFVFIAIIFTIGCTNHLLKPHQSDPSILVKLEKSSGRNITTGDYQITTWIENRDGTESHHQEINSTAGADASIIFEELAIGSEINIHLEVVETGTTSKKLVGTSNWITVKEGTNVVVIVLREDSDTGEIDDPVAGDDPEDEGDPVLTSFEVQYDSNQYQLVNTNIDLSKITITEYYNNADTGTSVKASEVSNDYIIAFGVDTSNAIGNVPANVEYKHDSTIKKQQFIIPIKYQLDANNLTISGNSSVEQNEELKLTAEYKVDGNDSYNLYTSASSSDSYKIIENVTISWTGATAQSNPWEANANTASTGSQTATVKLTSTDTKWCVTTGGVEKSHEYTVLALGSQDNPVTTWEQLTSAIASTTNPIYVDTNSMEATSTIEITGTTEIIPLKDLTIEKTSNFTNKFFDVKTGGDLTLGDGSNTITLDGKGLYASEPLVDTSGNLTLNKVELKNGNNTSDSSTGGIFIFSGNTTLNNVSFSGNTSGLSGAADLFLYQGAQLSLAESFASTEIYFSAAMSTTTYPVQLNQNLSLQDANKVKITVGSTTPENMQVVTKNGYTGDLNDLFTIVGADGTSYSLDEEGKIVENTQSSIPENGLSYDSSTDTLTIYNEAGLKNFRNIVNGTLEEELSVDNKTFKAKEVNRTVNATLANNIAVSENEDWIPIGKDATNGYAATFDGKGYTISGISNKSNSSSYRGFFGYTQFQATIKNLTVAGEFSKAGMYSGGLIGHANGGTIQYCVNKINITTDSSGIGGIVGYVYNNAVYTTTITGCVNLAAIQGGSKVGGIVGDNGSSSQNKVVLNQCINAGTITATDSSGSASGIFAYPTVTNGNIISNSLNLGTITCSNGSGVGITDNKTSLTIQYCLSAGTISASSKYAVASSTSGTQTKNYYDSSKITQTQSQASGNASKATSALKVANAWDTSWTTTNWNFAAGRYPVPNIKDNIPPDIWKDIEEKAQQ